MEAPEHLFPVSGKPSGVISTAPSVAIRVSANWLSVQLLGAAVRRSAPLRRSNPQVRFKPLAPFAGSAIENHRHTIGRRQKRAEVVVFRAHAATDNQHEIGGRSPLTVSDPRPDGPRTWRTPVEEQGARQWWRRQPQGPLTAINTQEYGKTAISRRSTAPAYQLPQWNKENR